MTDLTPKQLEQAEKAGSALNAALKPLLILRSVAWPDECRVKFLESGALPNPTYDKIDVSESLELVKTARSMIEGDHVVFDWLRRTSMVAENTAHMISHRGTKAFSHYSQSLYGVPTEHLIDRKTKVIDLAKHLDATLDDLDVEKLVVDGYETVMDAKSFAEKLAPELIKHFGEAAPRIEISSEMSAKAVAGSTRIRVRESARFSEGDVYQLLQHEALVHVATSLNGKRQPRFPVLRRAHAGTTEVQEGLAVFAEVISGALDPVRFRRLADRVIAIQMSLDGADFKEVYDFYRPRSVDEIAAYENTRRIFRGGVIGGGAPFTKDMVYLNGLLRVHNFMRSVVKLGRADLIRLLFVGKLDIEDIPALANLAHSGAVDGPEFMPPWAKDLRFLVSYLAYSSFLNQVKMPGFQAYYEKELEEVPVVWTQMG